MQAIFRFVPHNGLRAVDHFGRHLFAAMRGQAVHEESTGVGSRHHGAVDLIVGKVATALFVFFFKTHGGFPFP